MSGVFACLRDLAVTLVLGAIAAATLASAVHAQEGAVFLTPDERGRAVSIARSDPRVLGVLAGGGFRVDDLLPWSADGTRETLMGAEVTIELDPPRTLEADWPLLDFPVDNAHYTVTPVHYRADEVEWLYVDVDFREQRVVAFDVGGGIVDEDSVRVIGEQSPVAESASNPGRPAGVVAAVCAGAALAAAGAVAVARRRRR